ncbi:MAG: histidinol dehydrogenase, partial [Mesorhizobium sp.]
MAITLSQTDADFELRFSAFLTTKREVSADVEAVVRDIVARVRAAGDKALIDYTLKFDKADLNRLGIAVSRADIEKAYAAADPATV